MVPAASAARVATAGRAASAARVATAGPAASAARVATVVPAARPTSTPPVIFAIAGLAMFHFTLSPAIGCPASSRGWAAKRTVSPASSAALAGESTTDATSGASTVRVAAPVLLPLVAVMMVEPLCFAVTSPTSETTAIDVY